jgi:hypothetical protein
VSRARALVAHFEDAGRMGQLLGLISSRLREISWQDMPPTIREALLGLRNIPPEALLQIFASLYTGALACEFAYTIYGSGDVVIHTHVVPTGELPPLPRVGLQMGVPEEYNTFSWYGRGPHETYADRKSGARVGLYRGTVDDQYVPYITPQENGNKADVRWVALTDEEGVGLLAVGMPLLNASAHHFTTEDLAQATHTYELARREDICWSPRR